MAPNDKKPSMKDLLEQIEELKRAAAEAATAEFDTLRQKVDELVDATDSATVLKELSDKFSIQDLKTVIEAKAEKFEKNISEIFGFAPATSKPRPQNTPRNTEATDTKFSSDELAEFRAMFPVDTIIKKAGEMTEDYIVTNRRIPGPVVKTYRAAKEANQELVHVLPANEEELAKE